MQLWPAIDVRGGRCVRLLKGEFSAETVYGDPLLLAEAFVAEGASRLHVVDLDAARGGGAPDRDIVLRMAKRLGVPVQVGGGVHDEAAAAALLDAGVARVVVGTVALEEPEVLAHMVGRWPGRILVGLDHRTAPGPDGSQRREVAVRGWATGAGVELDAALQALEGLALAGIVVTDIDRDGTGSGPDLAGLEHVLGLTEFPVLASGGVARASDLAALCGLRARRRRLTGAVVGRALLAGSMSIAEAVGACGP